MSITKSDVTFHRPTDNTDPGFAVRGKTLRWVSGGVEARRAPRFWKPLKISTFTKDLQDKVRERVGSLVDGDTIRRRDLILSFAPNELVADRKKDLREQQRANEAVFRPNAGVAGNDAMRTTKDTGIKNEVVTSGNFN